MDSSVEISAICWKSYWITEKLVLNFFDKCQLSSLFWIWSVRDHHLIDFKVLKTSVTLTSVNCHQRFDFVFAFLNLKHLFLSWEIWRNIVVIVKPFNVRTTLTAVVKRFWRLTAVKLTYFLKFTPRLKFFDSDLRKALRKLPHRVLQTKLGHFWIHRWRHLKSTFTKPIFSYEPFPGVLNPDSTFNECFSLS